MNPELRGDSFLIVGYGREGQSIHQYLTRRYPRARIGIADRNPVQLKPQLEGSASLFCGNDYLSEARTFATIIRSPGVNIREISPQLAPHSYLTSATNIFFAECPGRIVGITGTKGKSTTASLTAAILSRGIKDVRLVGNIGTPMLDHLENATDQTYFVIELSSYQLEDLHRSPHIAILLNIVPEHLDYHDGFENYCSAKLNIARHQTRSDLLIFNHTLTHLSQRTAQFASRRRQFCERPDTSATTYVENGTILLKQAEGPLKLLTTDELPVRGPGNLQNTLAAITCGAALGIPPSEIRSAILQFTPLEHRLEFVAERDGITFYNDSLSTIPEALANALAALGSKVETVIAGGFDRGVDMTVAGPALAASTVKNLILFPTTGEKLWHAAVAASHGSRFRRFDVNTMDEAVQTAYNCTRAGAICVLSPASSSFSVFRDYRDRGNRFKEAVQRLSRTCAANQE